MRKFLILNRKWKKLKTNLHMHIKSWEKQIELWLLHQIDSLKSILIRWSKRVLNIRIYLTNTPSINKRRWIYQQIFLNDINNEKTQALTNNIFLLQAHKQWLSRFMRFSKWQQHLKSSKLKSHQSTLEVHDFLKRVLIKDDQNLKIRYQH